MSRHIYIDTYVGWAEFKSWVRHRYWRSFYRVFPQLRPLPTKQLYDSINLTGQIYTISPSDVPFQGSVVFIDDINDYPHTAVDRANIVEWYEGLTED